VQFNDDGTTHLAGMITRIALSDDQSATLNQIPLEAVQSSLSKVLEDRFLRSKGSLPRPTPSSSKTDLPRSAHDRKQVLLLDSIEAEVKSIIETLNDINERILTSPMEMRTLLDQVADKVHGIGLSLKGLSNTHDLVCIRKDRVLQALQRADTHITQLGAILGSDFNSVNRINIDSGRSLINLPIYNWLNNDSLGRMLESPVASLDTIAQVTLLLGAVSHFVIGLSGKSCDFILGVISMLIRMSMALGLPEITQDCYSAGQAAILQQLPTSIHQALSHFDLDSYATVYAACPSCNSTHTAVYDRVTTIALYPDVCSNKVLTKNGWKPCDTGLVEERKGCQRPLKPFVSNSLHDYLGRLLTDAEAERLCKKACDDAFKQVGNPPTESRNIFESAFLRNFRGPDQERLFIDRGNSIRLVLAMHVDFFNPNTSRRAATESIGIITLVVMNLPEDMRYKPEFIFPVGIIPGPREPPLEELNHYIRPIIEQIRDGWMPGYHISNTADSPIHGEHVDVALLLSINDLPAARKVSGTAGVTANIYCTVCSCRNRDTMYRTDCSSWESRDVHTMRKYAETWRDAETLAERERIEEEHGIRWSELWMLPYWDPTQMLVIDSMHCILEGLVHYHCRHVLCLDSAQAKINTQPAFSYPWTQYDDNINPEYDGFTDKDQKELIATHNLLERPLGIGEGKDFLDGTLLRKRLINKKKIALKFVVENLNLLHSKVRNDAGIDVIPTTKKHYAELLVKWV